MAFFTIELVTPEKIVLRQEADQVTVPTPNGEITILPHHIPLVTTVSPGELRVKLGTEDIPLAVAGGFLEIQGNLIRVLTDAAERVEEIDEQRAEEARKRAEDLRKQAIGDEKLYGEATALLERSLARLRISRKYRHRRRGTTIPPQA